MFTNRYKYILLVLFVGTIPLTVQSAARLPFSSSFEANNFSEWNGGADASLTVTNEDSSNGQYSARAQMSSGSTADNYKDFYFGDHASVNGAPATNGLWLELDSKFDAGFDFGTERIHKIAIINFEDENRRRRYQVIINVRLPEEIYFIENLAWNADRSFDKTVDAYSQNIGQTLTMNRGQWDKLKLYIQLNTPGSRNGIVKFWQNDQLIMDFTDTYLRENTNFNPNKLILSNYTRNTDIIGIQRWDNFYLGIDPPASVVRPNPPQLLE
ncbi:MAG: hypothetical protein OQK98_06015 [Gammaproteobacteria bacterium]|nr:hypothetical protein [Gammaproteobacteria bacterium]